MLYLNLSIMSSSQSKFGENLIDFILDKENANKWFLDKKLFDTESKMIDYLNRNPNANFKQRIISELTSRLDILIAKANLKDSLLLSMIIMKSGMVISDDIKTTILRNTNLYIKENLFFELFFEVGFVVSLFTNYNNTAVYNLVDISKMTPKYVCSIIKKLEIPGVVNVYTCSNHDEDESYLILDLDKNYNKSTYLFGDNIYGYTTLYSNIIP